MPNFSTRLNLDPLSTHTSGGSERTALRNGSYFNEEQLETSFAREMHAIQRYFSGNQAAYANYRRQIGQNDGNLRVISRKGYNQLSGITSSIRRGQAIGLSRIEFVTGGRGAPTFSYFPPKVTNSIKPFEEPPLFITMHSFGLGFDRRVLREATGSSARTVAIDPTTGHNPRRWVNGISTLLNPNATSNIPVRDSNGQIQRDANNNVIRRRVPNKSAIHHMISLRGDLVNSVSWDNECQHAGGRSDLRSLRVNAHSIGIEHEGWKALQPGKTRFETVVDQGPFSEEQLAIDAFIIRKLMAYTGHNYLRFLGFGGTAHENIRNRVTGCFNHFDTSTHHDPGADFFISPGYAVGSDISNYVNLDIPQHTKDRWDRWVARWYGDVPNGTRLSAYERIFSIAGRIRSFNLQTDVFDPALASGPIEVTPPAVTGTYTTRAAQRSARNRISGVDRAQRMQNQSRSDMFDESQSHTSNSAQAYADSTARLAQVTENGVKLPIVVNALGFNYSTGKWENHTTRSEPSTVQVNAQQNRGDVEE